MIGGWDTTAAFRDPWFWISLVTLSGWAYFIAHEAPRNWWRIPRDYRDRIGAVLNRPVIIEPGRAVVFSSRDRFLEVACDVVFQTLAEGECVQRGVPPEVFAARRGRKDFDA